MWSSQNLTYRSRRINLIIAEITVLTYPQPGNNSVNDSPVCQLRCYEGSWGIFPSFVHASSYRRSYRCARCVQVHRRRSSTTKCQISHRRCSLPIPNLSMTAFSFCELHRRNHWGCQDCTTYWSRVLPQLKLSRTQRQPRDFLSRESWKHFTKLTGFNWKKKTKMSFNLNLPMLIISPKTDDEFVVEQFQRSFSNCFWHSVIPRFAPCLRVGMRSGLDWQTFICCEDKPGTP